MNIIHATIVSVTGAWLIVMCFIMNTQNIKSAIVFKVIPFFLGISCLYVGAKMFELL